MAVEVVTGAPFSGKARFVRQDIERREADGELGLVALDFTALYNALVPGEQSALRDELVSDSGAPRLAAATFGYVSRVIAERELSGYVLTQSPRQAVELADRYGGDLLEVEADPGDVADRAEAHMTRLRRTIARAAVEALRPQCGRQAIAYFREQRQLDGRARVVRRSGRTYRRGGVRQPFDRALFERGLTPAGREALAALKAQGNAEPTPADIMAYLLRERRR